MTDKPLTLAEKIAVMQAAEDFAEIEFKWRHNGTSDWETTCTPSWNWYDCVYRVRIIKPSIDWSHVCREFNWMATDEDGSTYLFTTDPNLKWHSWEVHIGKREKPSILASFKAGTCNWENSLVGRFDK